MPSIPFAIRAAAAAAALAAGTTAGVATASTVTSYAGGGSVKHFQAETKRHAKRHKKAHAAPRHRRRRHDPTPTTTTTTPTTTTTDTTTTTKTTPTTTQTTPTTTTTKTTPTTTQTTPTTTTPTTTNPSSGTPQPTGVSGNWNLTFDDEFNSSSLNSSTWNPSGWTNNNMNGGSVASNVSESGGDLVLQVGSGGSTGAQVETRTAPFAVGDFAEASVYFAGSGTRIDNWPAWWVSGPNWPAAGESDIAEGLGTLTVNYHSPSGAHNQGTIPGTWAGGFHTYGIYRGSNYCDVYWDGQLVKHYSTDDNGQPENLIFTNGLANTIVPGAAGAMKVDYVRVWS